LKEGVPTRNPVSYFHRRGHRQTVEFVTTVITPVAPLRRQIIIQGK